MAVAKLAEAAQNPRNHRYSASRGIPKLRSAITDLYQRKFDVELDPETQVVTTIGAKEGFSHLMWVLVGPGDTALVPSPSYPIHIWGPLFAGADVRQVLLQGPDAESDDAPDPGEAFFDGLMKAWEESWPKPRVIVLSFPHNPTTACVDLSFMERLVAFAREHEVVLVHDFAYADLGFDGYDPPSILQVPGCLRRGGGDLHHDQVVLHGRVGASASWSATRRSSRRSPSSRRISTTGHSSRFRSPPSSP